MPNLINGGIARVSDKISDAVDVSVGATKHAAFRVASVAEDLYYSGSRTIKRHPAKAVLAGIGVGFAAGLLFGRLTRRR